MPSVARKLLPYYAGSPRPLRGRAVFHHLSVILNLTWAGTWLTKSSVGARKACLYYARRWPCCSRGSRISYRNRNEFGQSFHQAPQSLQSREPPVSAQKMGRSSPTCTGGENRKNSRERSSFCRT